jgi:hypothetical protein
MPYRLLVNIWRSHFVSIAKLVENPSPKWGARTEDKGARNSHGFILEAED